MAAEDAPHPSLAAELMHESAWGNDGSPLVVQAQGSELHIGELGLRATQWPSPSGCFGLMIRKSNLHDDRRPNV
jgi:hypothetical protein